MDDINDTDLLSLLQSSLEAADESAKRMEGSQKVSSVAEPAAGQAAEGQVDSDPPHLLPQRRAFDSLLIFCNNVAFNAGTIHR